MKPEPQALPRPEQVLSCWKDIASYLRRDVRTVQRWEQSRGLPVHRLPGQGKNAVYARTSELDVWWAGSSADTRTPAVVALPAARSSVRRSAVWRSVALLSTMAVGLWIVLRPAPPPIPTRPELLTSLPGAEACPSLSRTGERLVFSWLRSGEQNCDLYLMTLPAGQPERLTDGRGVNWFPEWSPDGSMVAYFRTMFGSPRFEIRLIDAATREDRLLSVELLGGVSAPAWALAWTLRGGALILNTASAQSQSWGLSLHEIASGRQSQLTLPDRPGYWDTLPTVSPDGKSLLFLRRKKAGDGNVFRQDLKPDGSAAQGPLRQVTHEPCCVDSPSWTADGKEVVFLSRRGGVPRLMRVSAHGGEPRHDASIATPGSAPRVAANGWLVSWEWETANRVFEAPLKDGTAVGPARELISSSRRDTEPAFSPDGRQIVFRSNRSGLMQLWTCRRDGSAPRQLTSLDGLQPFFPDWSATGKWIAFEGRDGPTVEVYLADATTGKHWRVSADGASARLPRWSRNGKSLYVASDLTGRNETWRIDVDEAGQAHRHTQLTREGGFSGLESPDGRFVYYSKDLTMTSIWRVPSGGGHEAEILANFPMSRNPASLAAGPDGLYFRGQRRVERKASQPIWMLPFAGGPPRKVMDETTVPSTGIAVSPDGRSILLPAMTYDNGDIFAYKHFR